ncbi:uncharacterized protein LOC121921817 [Sceloporus undulatus]|uniref:uncharacterized protein LOC121921817 n=1 Tax=Sceloporus undulatus TaxID=8520 RepID=UPI001C4BEC0E|nr:uncharacterized protein LOC121921817 [Sceloporus undulatus]XP_042306338.1 uncharacterized protein LOC121921817 [Sceloporus undulatus]XP_042306339.1 uncharacterized protein LOC121921817 [Sceloporus undulatus]XP_042306341.1 uncharacterized protein LOC121921817 [Sceloporus undulatus]XP_042306342.1 uncharacterized protein LOC121921817 [Sceloporus undulatus]XP_042306343.1 uncharacterized protein LOC121921817 [Sceloporus undulatus]
MAECGFLRSGPRVNQRKRDSHVFRSGAALSQNKQELDEGFQPRQESWQQEKDPNTVLSPYSVWRPSRLFEPVSSEDMKEFKTSYQSLKDASQLPRGGGAIAMQTLPDLGGKIREACESWEGSERLKEQIPEEADPDRLEIKRQHFRHFCYQEIEGPRAVLSKLQELCHQWLVPERHTKEQIVDLVVLEQFLTILPLEMQIWVCKSGPATCAQALALAESFLLRLQEAENQEPKGSGLVEEAFITSPTLKQDLSDTMEICISEAEEEQEAILMGGAAVAQVGACQLETKLPAAVHRTDASPVVVEVQLQDDSVREMEQKSPAPASRRKVPWSGFEKAFTYVRQRGKNLVVQCNYCLPAYKTVSAAITSSSNLKKHLERAHPEKLKIIESTKRARRRGYSVELRHDDDPPALKMPKQHEQQTAPDRWGYGKETVTQRILDKKIMDFIVEETLPLQTVDRASFIGLVRLGLPKGLTIMCANTLRDRIEKRAAGMRETLASRMGVVSHVATTADCWTDGKRNFLGVTAHWISPTTLKREFGALSYKRLKGHLTYSVLAKALHDVHMQYRIHNKVVCTTTDNGSNFVKAFRVFRAKELEDATETSAEEEEEEAEMEEEEEEDDNQEDSEVKFLPVSELLDTGNKAEEEIAGSKDFSLPPHQRCISHTLNLVATQDIQTMVSDSSKNSLLGPFRRHFSSLMEKCSKLWSKQKQSKQLVEYIREQCGVCLKVPNKTRWNSTFDALKQLNELLSTVPLKVDAIMDQCSLARFTPAESLVVQEYTEIMWPLAQSLDILQRENGMFMGYLLPTLYNLDRKLQGLENKPVRYTYCLPLLKGVREALRKRFAGIWEDKKLLLAACLHPRFKVDWLESAQTAQINRYMMEALVKAEIRGTVSEENDRSSEKDQDSDSLEDDFFNIRPRGKKSAVDSADEEVWDYLKCPSREVSSLHAFPRVMQSFLQYNTGMPSSAAAERLFCAECNGATVKRHSLSDEVFEQLVLLRQNRALF